MWLLSGRGPEVRNKGSGISDRSRQLGGEVRFLVPTLCGGAFRSHRSHVPSMPHIPLTSGLAHHFHWLGSISPRLPTDASQKSMPALV